MKRMLKRIVAMMCVIVLVSAMSAVPASAYGENNWFDSGLTVSDDGFYSWRPIRLHVGDTLTWKFTFGGDDVQYITGFNSECSTAQFNWYWGDVDWQPYPDTCTGHVSITPTSTGRIDFYVLPMRSDRVCGISVRGIHLLVE